MSGPVSSWMGDHLWAGKPYRYVTTTRLSLLPSTGGKVSISHGWKMAPKNPRFLKKTFKNFQKSKF